MNLKEIVRQRSRGDVLMMRLKKDRMITEREGMQLVFDVIHCTDTSY